MYKQLSVKEEADGYHIMLSGESNLPGDLGLVPDEVTHSSIDVTFIMKKQDCLISEKDRRLISCGLPENTTLPVTLKYYDTDWNPQEQIWEVPYLTLGTVDIVETNASGMVTHNLESRFYLAKKVDANANQWVVGYDTRVFPNDPSMGAGCKLQ